MNACDMDAVAPEEALRIACDAFGKEFHVSASPELVDYYRVWRVDNPLSQFISFHYKNVPYRRGKDRAVIFPMVQFEEKDFNPEWLDAPEEYIECYGDGKILMIPVIRKRSV